MQRVLKDQLRRAFDERALQVHYQPKFHLTTGGLRGVEALLRWRTADGTWVAPSTFVPLLEEMEMISEVGAWLFERTAMDCAWWRDRGLDVGRMAINVSPLQLRCKNFLSWVLTVSDSWSLLGTGLDIELTESTLLPEPANMAAAMDALVAADVRFALDDFGTGYSSLDLLMRLPVRYLKIDRSFVGRMLSNAKAASLVEAIIQMSHAIGLETIAEGVETADQLHRLRALGADIGQGHYFLPAMSREELLEQLRPRSGRCFHPAAAGWSGTMPASAQSA